MKERFEEQLTQLNETAKLLATLTDALQFAEDNYTDIFYNAELARIIKQKLDKVFAEMNEISTTL